ncbi:helix-turn-helix domain-containing protein [Pseudochrobactrum sp. sp1633]|uniref:helix-turn-helix domain-containing protein n=1 Tax=Pseudochrobactrum sp. sp1633 TaxID=3036706 RepID=UPI0025A5A395|nr:helix-turn-helix domain-containing protein [Pseudochrobactrum sp. sp1633]MDM8344155.1 helix-turn-helix domain-containing protein [Pseudochrobactrum sp. sp1633]
MNTPNSSTEHFDDLDGLLSEEEAADLLKLVPRTLTVWRTQSKGPRFLKIGRRVFYRREWLVEFARSRIVDPAAREVRAAR